MVSDLKQRPRTALAQRKSHHPRIHRACLILECTTILVAARLYLDHPFPGLLAPMFGGAYLVLVSAAATAAAAAAAAVALDRCSCQLLLPTSSPAHQQPCPPAALPTSSILFIILLTTGPGVL